MAIGVHDYRGTNRVHGCEQICTNGPTHDRAISGVTGWGFGAWVLAVGRRRLREGDGATSGLSSCDHKPVNRGIACLLLTDRCPAAQIAARRHRVVLCQAPYHFFLRFYVYLTIPRPSRFRSYPDLAIIPILQLSNNSASFPILQL